LVEECKREDAGSIVQATARHMGMKATLEVVNAMEADGVIDRYAISDAVAHIITLNRLLRMISIF
jgi:hypothetical protein